MLAIAVHACGEQQARRGFGRTFEAHHRYNCWGSCVFRYLEAGHVCVSACSGQSGITMAQQHKLAKQRRRPCAVGVWGEQPHVKMQWCQAGAVNFMWPLLPLIFDRLHPWAPPLPIFSSQPCRKSRQMNHGLTTPPSTIPYQTSSGTWFALQPCLHTHNSWS
jgi:hypothetical protein